MSVAPKSAAAKAAAPAVPFPPDPSVFSSHCPTQKVLERIADKWATILVYALSDRTMRFSELRRRVDGVSQKMLTQTLRNLERDGLVDRRVYAVVPPRVEYRLTPLGKTLLGPLRAVCHWAEKHLPEVEAAQLRYAERRAAEDE
ncbi:MAG: helix-turn-helix transcriptional regulator [Planctomycetes bacterium]|nr:helix-turn-helix transcriptional regulator [Planctomycetota bacterium]